MHNIYGIIYIISNIILLISSAPTTKELQHKSIYELLIEHSLLKCPYLKATKLLEPTPSFLKHCSDYTTLKTVKSLTRETEYDILCILYTNNYMNLCDSLPINSTIDNKDIDTTVNTSKLEKTCESLSNSKFTDDFKDAANVLSNFKSAETCASLCKELTVSRVTPICSLAALTLNLAKQIQQNPVKVQPKEKPQQGSENVNHSKPLNKINQAVSVPKPQITNNNNNNNGETDDKVKLPQNQPEIQNKPPLDLPEKVVPPSKTQDLPHPVGPMVPNTDLGPQKGAESEDNAAKPNPVVTQDKNPQRNVINDDTSHDVNIPVPPSTEVPSTKISDVKKDNADVIEENQQMQPQVVEGNGKSSQELQLDQNSSTQGETDSLAVQNSKTLDNTDVKDNTISEGQLDGALPNSEDALMEDDDDFAPEPEKSSSSKVKQQPKPQETDEDVLIPPYNNSNSDEEDSFFFIYFMMVCAVFILGYLGYHNKQKVLALVIEGRRGRRGSRRGRPNSANYHKLDSNLEEAVTSACNKNSTNIIY